MVLIFVLIALWSGSKDLQRAMVLDMLCLTIGDRILIYSLTSRKVDSSSVQGYVHLWAQESTEIDTKEEEQDVRKNLFSNPSIQILPFVSFTVHAKIIHNLLFRHLINTKINI